MYKTSFVFVIRAFFIVYYERRIFNMKLKIDSSKLLGLSTIALGIISTIISSAKEKNEKKILKNEITKEVLKNLNEK